ncbi:MAG: DUF6691 family protein [Pseudomonadota bacterium]
MRQNLLFLALGALFGFLLSGAGATEPELIARLFLFQDLHLMWVILAAILTGATGITFMRRAKVRALGSREPIQFERKPWGRGLIAGSLLFGIGWGLTGACPGTALTMLGEGKLYALPVIMGMLVGTWLFGQGRSRTQPS